MKKLNLISRLLSYSHEKQKPQRFARYAAMLIMLLTLGVGQMWAAVTLYYQKDMPSGNYSASSSATMTQSSANSNRYYCEVSLQNGSYGFYIKNGNDYYKANATASSNRKVRVWNYGSTNYGNSSDRITYSTGAAKTFIFTVDFSNSDDYVVYVSPKSSETVKVAWSVASGHDGDYNLPNYTGAMTQDGANYYVDIDLTAVKHYMFIQISNSIYWRGEPTLTENGTASSLWDYGTSNYGNSAHKANFTPGAAAKYRFTWNHDDKTIKYQRLYNISYQKGDNGTGSTQTDYKVHGTNITLRSSGDFTRTGYTQTAWNTNSAGTGGTSYSLGGSYSTDAVLTLYPTWTAKTTTVTLSANAPAGSTVTGGGTQVTATYDSALPSFSALTCNNGYALKGYYTNTSGGTKVINADGTFAANSGIWNRTDGATLTLHAQWSLDRTLTYDANGGTGTMTDSNSPYANGATVTVQSNSFTRTGYTFTGWNTVANGSGTPYSAGNTFSISANTTLFAQWSENMTTVNFVASPAGAGTFTVDDTPGQTSTTVGVTTTHDVTAVPYPGYRITGSNYWTAENANISLSSRSTNPTTVTGCGTASTSSNLTATFTTMYAYVEGRFQVKNAARNSTTYTGVAGNGYWATDSRNIKFNYDGTNHRYELHTYMKPSELSAQLSNNTQYFKIQTSTSTGSLTGGSLYTPASTSPTTNQKLTAAGTATKRATSTTLNRDASFWFDSSDATGYAILYFDESGVWYTLEHTLNYNGNGSTSGSAPSEAYYNNGSNATAASNPFLKTNYTFGGWNTNQYITGTTYAAGASVPMTANTTLYAKWTRSVTLNANGGGSGSTSVTATYNCATLPSITNPSRTGYTFAGWNTAADGTGSLVINTSGALQASKSGWTDASGRFTNTNATATLYAMWTAKTYTASNNIDKNGGDSDGKYTATYDATNITINTAPARTGYTIEGYYLEDGCTNKVATTAGALQASKGSLTDASNKWIYDNTDAKLYAKWTANTYTIAFNANDAQYVGTATGSTASVDATYDQNVTLTANGFSRTGYIFAGWATTPTGAVTYTNSQTVTKPNLTATQGATVTLYAKWTENTYSTNVAVSPAATGSITTPTPSVGKINISHHTGTAVTATPATDYVFDHWAYSGGGLSVSSTTTNPATFKATGTGGTITAYFEDQWNLKGSWDSWADYSGMPLVSGTTYRVTLTLEARRTYDFKVVKRTASGDTYYGSDPSTTFTRGGTTSKTGLKEGGGSEYNFHVTTDAAGDYTFTYVYNAAVKSMQVSVGFPTAYTITFDKGTGGSTITATASASGTLSSGNYVASGEDVTFTQTVSTGYTFSNWYTTKDAGGSVVTGMGASDPVLENVTANKTVYSRYTAHTYQVRFNKNDVGASGTMSNQSFTYDEASKALTSNAFYKDGYSFDYWTTASDGTGTQYTDGQSVQNLSSTDNDVVDLYAHWTEVTITDLTFEPASAAGSTTVTVTPVLSGTPTGTSSICWGLYYDALCTREVPGIEFSANPSAGAASVTFTSPASSGSYYVKATYRTGSACNAGTVLGEPRIEQYVVASKHDLTVKYMCGSTEITSRRIVEIPAASYTLVAPAEVFGYTFSSWSAGDGVTITDPTDAEKEEAGLDDVEDVKKVTATYDGILTANYSKKNIIYFKNTLNWDGDHIYVHLHSYWTSDQGAGNKDNADRNLKMSLVPGTTDIYYREYSSSPSYIVAFTDRSQANYQGFAGSAENRVRVVYPSRPSPASLAVDSVPFGFNAGTPMFVPLTGQTEQLWNKNNEGKNLAEYYNKGYWREYEPATGKTGYTLEIYNKRDGDSGRKLLYSIPMVDASGDDVFEATIELEANKNLGVKFLRNNDLCYTKTSDGAAGTLNPNGTTYLEFHKQNAINWAAAGLNTTAAGNYTFRLTCANDGWLKMAVTYPTSDGDYRLMYKDNDHPAWHPSDIVRKVNNGTDIVSFFVRTGSKNQSLQIQSCDYNESTGAVTWSNYVAAINPASTYSSVITEDGVYNFHLAMDEDGALTISKVEPYTGDFYIRTDAVGGTKWADFRNEAHRMTYSDYAAANKGFTHYYVNWVTQNSNVKFTVANDYSPCISDTLVADPTGNVVASIDGDGKMTSANANIRYMYNVKDNTIKRAYIAGAQDNGSYFLVLQGQNGYITDPSGNRLMSANGNNYDVDNDATQLADNNEWLYKISVKATPGGKVKLYARYNTVDQYFIGKAAVDDWSTAEAYEVLISGDGGAQNISVVYDFKTDRMIAAWEPADEINSEMTLDADILIVREHQKPANNITFGDAAYSLTTDKTVYGVMRFYRNTLDNRDGDGNLLPVADQLSQRERYHYYISFPFDVNVSDIFGFGSYGVHWVLQYYDGKERAKKGLWADPGMTYWKYVPPTGKLNANEGYLLALSPSKMAYSNTDDGQVWAKGKSVVELYFPDATMGATIKDDNVTIPAPSEKDYKCTIWRGEATGEHEGDRNYDRRIADSYWRCIGVPSFKDFSADLTDGTSAYAWVDPAAYTTGDIHFLYEIQWTDYSLRAVSADNFDFKAMHAYLVQNSTAIVWNHVNAISHSSSIVARHRNATEIDNVEFRLELQQNNELVDQTFVRLSDDEAVTAGFEFNHDMSKELYSTKANIYTLIGMEPVAANSLPISTQTTVVPVGIKIAADGDYTFSMPDGTEGIGITLIDNETGIRTSLSALDYTINLSAGTYDNRFILEISPIQQMPTGVELLNGENGENGVRKVMIDGLLYIVKDGKMFDAQGRQVK